MARMPRESTDIPLSNLVMTYRISYMKTKVPWILYTVPVLYLALIFAFIYLQFSEVSRFNAKVAHLTFSGELTRSPWSEENEIKTLQIYGSGMVFNFNRETPLKIQTKDGLVHRAEPQSYESGPQGGVIIRMKNNLSFTVTQDPEAPETVRISIDAADYGSIRNIVLPFSLMQDFEMETAGGLPIFSIYKKTSSEVTVLGLPLGSLVDAAGNQLLLTPREDGFGDLIIEQRDGESADPYSYWFSRQGDLLTKEEYHRIVDSFMIKAVKGWRETRFNRQTLTWATKEGEAGFNELAAAAILTEERGSRNYATLLENLTLAGQRATGPLSLVTAPALGDIVEKTDFTRETLQLKKENLIEQITRKDRRVFMDPDLYFVITAMGTAEERSALAEMAASTIWEEQDLPTAVGMLDFYHQAVLEEGRPWKEIESFVAIPEKLIFPAIRVTENGFFINTEKDHSSVLLAVRAAAALIRCGELGGKELHGTLGREVMASLLQMADDEGYLPEDIFFEDQSAMKIGFLAPENIYPFLTDSPRQPRFVSLYREAGRGRWLFTSAEAVEFERGSDTETYHITAAAGETHYLAIQGVKPGFTMKLLGINWNPDPIFQYYYAGWYYDQKNQALYIKIRHSRPKEEIRLYYPPKPLPTEKTEPAEGSTGENTPGASAGEGI